MIIHIVASASSAKVITGELVESERPSEFGEEGLTNDNGYLLS